jgi:hypothetical protein
LVDLSIMPDLRHEIGVITYLSKKASFDVACEV